MGYYERSEQQCNFALNVLIDTLRKKKRRKSLRGSSSICFTQLEINFLKSSTRKRNYYSYRYTSSPNRNLFIAIIRESLCDAIYTKEDTFLENDKQLLYLCQCANLEIDLLMKFKELIKNNEIRKKNFFYYFRAFIRLAIE